MKSSVSVGKGSRGSKRLGSGKMGTVLRPRTASVSWVFSPFKRWIATTDGSAVAIASAMTVSIDATTSAGAGPGGLDAGDCGSSGTKARQGKMTSEVIERVLDSRSAAGRQGRLARSRTHPDRLPPSFPVRTPGATRDRDGRFTERPYTGWSGSRSEALRLRDELGRVIESQPPSS